MEPVWQLQIRRPRLEKPHRKANSNRSARLVSLCEVQQTRICSRGLLGAWGVGTYRQNDSLDVRYEAPDSSPRVAEGLEINAS
jgi:hypothetical protein